MSDFFLASFFFFKQKTAYDMRISDWSSDVCSSDLAFLGIKPEKPWAKWGVRGGIAILLLILILLLTRCLTDGNAAQYATQEVERGDLTVTVSATGNLKPINQVDVGSEQSGLITDVYVDVNDRVTKGQVLARLDTSRLIDTVNQRTAALPS